jgi:hypothetical protein
MKNGMTINDDNMRKQKYEFGIGSLFIAFISYGWASTIVQEWGQKPSARIGVVLGLALCFLLLLLLVDYLLWRWRFTKAIRSSLWAAAILGPYAALVAWAELGHPVWSQMIGAASAILIFVVFYLLENRSKTAR